MGSSERQPLFEPGDEVEVKTKIKDHHSGWYAAEVESRVRSSFYLVVYKTPPPPRPRSKRRSSTTTASAAPGVTDTDPADATKAAQPLRVIVHASRMRHCPPPGRRNFPFTVDQPVEAFYRGGWWPGVVAEAHHIQRRVREYSVIVQNTKETITCRANLMRRLFHIATESQSEGEGELVKKRRKDIMPQESRKKRRLSIMMASAPGTVINRESVNDHQNRTEPVTQGDTTMKSLNGHRSLNMTVGIIPCSTMHAPSNSQEEHVEVKTSQEALLIAPKVQITDDSVGDHQDTVLVNNASVEGHSNLRTQRLTQQGTSTELLDDEHVLSRLAADILGTSMPGTSDSQSQHHEAGTEHEALYATIANMDVEAGKEPTAVISTPVPEPLTGGMVLPTDERSVQSPSHANEEGAVDATPEPPTGDEVPPVEEHVTEPPTGAGEGTLEEEITAEGLPTGGLLVGEDGLPADEGSVPEPPSGDDVPPAYEELVVPDLAEGPGGDHNEKMPDAEGLPVPPSDAPVEDPQTGIEPTEPPQEDGADNAGPRGGEGTASEGLQEQALPETALEQPPEGPGEQLETAPEQPPEGPREQPNTAPEHPSVPEVSTTISFDDLLRRSLARVDGRALFPVSVPVPDAGGASSSRLAAPVTEGIPVSDPGSTSHHEGKAPLLEPHPRTAEGESIRADCDFADPSVVRGLLDSLFAPAYQGPFVDGRSGSLSYLLGHGMTNIFTGLMEVMLADKRVASAETGDAQPSELQRALAEADDLRGQVVVLNGRLRARELESRRARGFDSDADYIKLERSLADQRLKSRAEARAFEEEIVRLRDTLSEREGELQDQLAVIQSRDVEIQTLRARNARFADEAARAHGDACARFGRAAAQLDLLGALRGLYREHTTTAEMDEREREATAVRQQSIEDKALLHESDVARIIALEAQVKGLTDLLDKVVAESGRMALPDASADPSDPRFFLLQQWHADEIALRSQLADWQNTAPQVINKEFYRMLRLSRERAAGEIEHERRLAYDRGYRKGQSDGVSHRNKAFDHDQEVDDHLRYMVRVLEDPASRDFQLMLVDYRAALAAVEAFAREDDPDASPPP